MPNGRFFSRSITDTNSILTPEQTRDLKEQLESAEVWLQDYPIGRLVGDTPMQAWKEWFELYTGTTVHVEITTDTDSVRLNDDGSWTLGLKLDDPESSGYHEKCHVIFSPFDEINKAGSVAADKLSDPRIMDIVNCLEDCKIELLGDRLLWPMLDMRSNHRAQLIRQILKHPSGAVIGLNGENGCGRNVSHGILSTVYDLPTVCIDPIVNDVLIKFYDDIKRAVNDLGGWRGLGDKMASVKLAIRIAEYLKWKQEKSEKDGEPCKSGNPSNEAGQGSNTSPEPTDTTEDTQDTEAEEGEDTEPQEQEDDTDDTKDGDSGKGEEGDDSGDMPDGISDEELDQVIGEIEKSTAGQVKIIERQVDRQRELNSTSDGMDRHHPYFTKDVVCVSEPPLHEKIRSMLDSVAEPLGLPRPSYRGRVNPRRVHAMQHGDMRVFQSAPKTRGPVIIMVDCSGSMGCPCVDCEEKLHTNIQAHIGATPESMAQIMGVGTASWQLARGISKSVGYDAEVYGFDSDGNKARIGRVDPRQQPGHYQFHGETPVCTALQYVEKRLGSNAKNATVIFITDGVPNVCPVTKTREDHSVEISNRIASRGADFIAIQLGSFRDVFPSSLCIKIPTVQYGKRMMGVDSNHLSSIGQAIKHIRGK